MSSRMFSTLTFQENVVVRTEDFHLFLATLVALHFTPVSKRVSHSFGLQPSSVAWSLRACYQDNQVYGTKLIAI